VTSSDVGGVSGGGHQNEGHVVLCRSGLGPRVERV
jgi:hypothetical protein